MYHGINIMNGPTSSKSACKKFLPYPLWPWLFRHDYFSHSLLIISWYVSRSLWELLLHPFILFSEFHRSWWAALSSICQTGILSMDSSYFIEKYFADHSKVLLVCALITINLRFTISYRLQSFFRVILTIKVPFPI